MRRHNFYLGMLATALLLAGAGCGTKGKPVKVKGVVTLDGKPVAGATVAFIPDGGQGHSANGRTRRDGAFELTTYRPGDGALPGKYTVTVTKIAELADSAEQGTPANPGELLRQKMTELMMPNPKAKARMQQLTKSTLPVAYHDPKKSPLKCEVPVDGPVELQLYSNQ